MNVSRPRDTSDTAFNGRLVALVGAVVAMVVAYGCSAITTLLDGVACAGRLSNANNQWLLGGFKNGGWSCKMVAAEHLGANVRKYNHDGRVMTSESRNAG